MNANAGSFTSKSATKNYSILVVDDHPIVRHGLSQIINQQNDLHVCAEAESAPVALNAIEKHHPDIALVDLSIQGSNGIELIKNIKSKYALPVLVVSIHDEALYAERSLRAGAKGYIMKHEATEKVLIAIRRILGGEIYLSERMGERLLQKYISGNQKSEVYASPFAKLTDRELEIFRLIGQGRSTRDISKDLSLSVKTIESHRAHIKQKLKLRNSVELVHQAVQWVQSEIQA